MANRWDGQERRDYVVLSSDQIKEMLLAAAEAGATAAIEKLYAEIGHSLVRKTLLVIGTALVAVLAWLNNFIAFNAPK